MKKTVTATLAIATMMLMCAHGVVAKVATAVAAEAGKPADAIVFVDEGQSTTGRPGDASPWPENPFVRKQVEDFLPRTSSTGMVRRMLETVPVGLRTPL